MDFRLYPEATEIASRAIYITGATRTGTTMMGRLISSLEGVEYAEEPPLIRILLPMIDELPEENFRMLFEGYLFEDHMMFTIPGRKINVNRFDQSSVYNSKSEAEVAKRLEKSYRRIEIFPMAQERDIAFKLPEVGQYLGPLLTLYPTLRTIVMLRRPESVIASMLEREWFGERELFGISGKWFFRKGFDWNIPDWLPAEEAEAFLAMSEVERCCRYYLFEYENLLATRKALDATPAVVVDYDSLTRNPRAQFAHLAERLGCRFGDMTDQLVDDIREPRKDRTIPMDKIGTELWSRVQAVYEECRSMAMTI